MNGPDLDGQVGSYAQYQQRLRATRIARTEIAAAYNQGGLLSIQETISEGLIEPGATKEWLTAEDERVCKICFPLDETVLPLDEPWVSLGYSAQAPPIHPQCRCTQVYDVEPVL